MYSSAKNLSAFAAILGAVTALAAIVFAFVVVPTFKMSWSNEFAATAFFLASAASNIFLILGLRSALSDLSIAEEANNSQIKALKKHVEELEAKLNQQ